MLESLIRITSSNHVYFQECLFIYADAFPSEERQPFERIVERVNSNTCELYCFLYGAKPVGMAILWDFSECEIMFLDYFAIATEYRRKGMGRLFLQNLFLWVSPKEKVLGLEIEHPNYGNNITERIFRMMFYTSNGAKILSNVRYIMPALDGTEDIEMLLLLLKPTEELPRREELQKFISNLYSNVYLLQPEHYLVNKIIQSIPAKIEICDSL